MIFRSMKQVEEGGSGRRRGKIGEGTEKRNLHNITSLTCADTAQGETGGCNSSVCEENHCAGCDAMYPEGGGNWFH